uniref:hypothetical protein n=1 Tax=Paludibacterium denitrificans TaxID=2675226 RepID=UPI002477D453|nr:hypothetical protein [Paludibacterium denitrificans]
MTPLSKGGTIRRITQALDARSYRVVPIAAPSEEERLKPWLWRFWRHIPVQGRHYRVRPLLVWPRAGGTCRRLCPRGRLDACLLRDQRL